MHDSRLEKLKQDQAQLAARIKDLESRNRQKARKDDTRRKVIAGSLALHHMEKNPQGPFAQTLSRLLDEYVTKPNERALFGLPPVPDVEPDAGSNATPVVLSGDAKWQPANDAEASEIIPLKEQFRTG